MLLGSSAAHRTLVTAETFERKFYGDDHWSAAQKNNLLHNEAKLPLERMSRQTVLRLNARNEFNNYVHERNTQNKQFVVFTGNNNIINRRSFSDVHAVHPTLLGNRYVNF